MIPVRKQRAKLFLSLLLCILFLLTTLTVSVAAASSYVGNKSTKVYHTSECTYAEKISSSNRVYFSSRSLAESNGYRRCHYCGDDVVEPGHSSSSGSSSGNHSSATTPPSTQPSETEPQPTQTAPKNTKPGESFMTMLFVILFLLSSQLIHSVAIDQQQGINPYPFGTWIFCSLLHVLLLVSAIFYLGWLWGIILFLVHLFGVLDLTIMWILNIPVFFIKEDRQIFTLATVRRNLLFPLLLANLIFTIVSFFIADYQALFHFLNDIPYSLVIILAVAAFFSIPRFIIMKLTSKIN